MSYRLQETKALTIANSVSSLILLAGSEEATAFPDLLMAQVEALRIELGTDKSKAAIHSPKVICPDFAKRYLCELQ